MYNPQEEETPRKSKVLVYNSVGLVMSTPRGCPPIPKTSSQLPSLPADRMVNALPLSTAKPNRCWSHNYSCAPPVASTPAYDRPLSQSADPTRHAHESFII